MRIVGYLFRLVSGVNRCSEVILHTKHPQLMYLRGLGTAITGHEPQMNSYLQ